MRKSVCDGQYYSKDFNELDIQIRDGFDSDFGPGDLPISSRDKKTFGIIVPHGDQKITYPCSAWAYKEVAESKFPDVYVILGTSYVNNGFKLSMENWETPFGVVKVDEGLGKLLTKELNFLHVDNDAHKKEFGIEVQLPLLQFVSRDNLHNVRILPILIGKDTDYEKLKILGRALGESERNIYIISTMNFTHYGGRYNHIPSMLDSGTEVKSVDKEAIRFIENLDSEGFFKHCKEKNLNFSSLGPAVVTIEACRDNGSKNAKLLRYYTSRDFHGHKDDFVGFGSLVFE